MRKNKQTNKEKTAAFGLFRWKWCVTNIEEIHSKIYATKIKLLCNFVETVTCIFFFHDFIIKYNINFLLEVVLPQKSIG